MVGPIEHALSGSQEDQQLQQAEEGHSELLFRRFCDLQAMYKTQHFQIIFLIPFFINSTLNLRIKTNINSHLNKIQNKLF